MRQNWCFYLIFDWSNIKIIFWLQNKGFETVIYPSVFNSRKQMKVILKITHKINNKIFGINAFRVSFLVIITYFLKILPHGSIIKSWN